MVEASYVAWYFVDCNVLGLLCQHDQRFREPAKIIGHGSQNFDRSAEGEAM